VDLRGAWVRSQDGGGRGGGYGGEQKVEEGKKGSHEVGGERGG